MSREVTAIAGDIIAAAIEVPSVLGPGLLESAYETALRYELRQRGVPFVRKLERPTKYKQLTIDAGYRVDLIIEERVVVTVKAVEVVLQVHSAMVLTYMKLTGCDYGLIINFNTVNLRDGLTRIVQHSLLN